MTRILHLTSVHGPFDQRIFFKQCRSLAQAGYDVTLLAPADFPERLRDGVRVLGLSKPSRRWQRALLWRQLLEKAIALQPALVHFHDPELLSSAPMLRRALGPQTKIVYDVHEYFVDSIAHKVWIPPWLRPLAGRLAGALEQRLGQAVDGLVFVVEEQAPFYDGWQARQAVVHNYPIAANFTDPRPLPDFTTDRFRLIYIGSLYARRGIMTILQALVPVVEQAPEALLILAGNFESDLFREQVERFIIEQGLTRHVLLLGWIDHARIKDFYASADVAWQPLSQTRQYHHRAISTKLLEAMLTGLPIVTSDHDFQRGFVDEARCGLTVQADDPQAHAEAVLWMYRHPEERRAMGARGRRLVLDRYTWETEAAVLADFYQLLLSGDARSGDPNSARPSDPC